MSKILRETRRTIARFLKYAADKVVQSYEEYLEQGLMGEDAEKKAKNFKSFHDSAKSASTHLESLLKIAKMSEDEEGDAEEKREAEAVRLDALIEAAQREIDEGNKQS